MENFKMATAEKGSTGNKKVRKGGVVDQMFSLLEYLADRHELHKAKEDRKTEQMAQQHAPENKHIEMEYALASQCMNQPDTNHVNRMIAESQQQMAETIKAGMKDMMTQLLEKFDKSV
jgi:hypothetical protein